MSAAKAFCVPFWRSVDLTGNQTRQSVQQDDRRGRQKPNLELNDLSFGKRAVQVCPAEEELWAWLGAQDNKAGYIKGLIRADMEARREGRPAKNMERHEHL